MEHYLNPFNSMPIRLKLLVYASARKVTGSFLVSMMELLRSGNKMVIGNQFKLLMLTKNMLNSSF
jgi:hypothetical protein